MFSHLNRSEIIDWMVSACQIVKNIEMKTFFIAVRLLDCFIDSQRSQWKPIKVNDLFLIGMVCIFIASKFEDNKPLTLEALLRRLGHYKYESEQVLDME
jgi:hypothetical protein